MPTLQAADIADLVAMTQRDLGRMKWTEIATDIQEHVAFRSLMRRNRVSFRSGYEIQWNVMTTHSGAARNVGLYEVDEVNVGDVMTTASIPWRHVNTNYAIDLREIDMNRTPARIVELVKIRRADAMISLAELMEADFWTKPTTSSDNLKPFGLQYWVVYNATEGFNGGDPSGFTTTAGIDSDTVTRWKNYSGQYTNVTKDDLVAKWRKAATFTRFMSPTEIPSYNTGDRFGYYTNYNVIGTLERELEDQNENLGNDIASKDGRTLFRQVPVTWAPYLENVTGDPVYGINWGVFKIVFLQGWFMRERINKEAANQHTVVQSHVDTTCNYECRDRRRNFVLATANPDPNG